MVFFKSLSNKIFLQVRSFFRNLDCYKETNFKTHMYDRKLKSGL